MELDYKIIDVSKDQMSTDIEKQLIKVKPVPGEVIALKGNTVNGFCYLPFIVLFNPENQIDGYHQMMLSILKRLEQDSEINSESNNPVEIDEIDCLNIDIEEGRLTAAEAYHAFITKELPDHYTGLLADPEDCEGEEWKDRVRTAPDYTEWCSKKGSEINHGGADADYVIGRRIAITLNPASINLSGGPKVEKWLSDNICAALVNSIIKKAESNLPKVYPIESLTREEIISYIKASLSNDEEDNEDDEPENLIPGININYYTMKKGKPVCKVLEGPKTKTIRIYNN